MDIGYWILDSERIGGKVLGSDNLQVVGRAEIEVFLPVVIGVNDYHVVVVPRSQHISTHESIAYCPRR